MNAKRIDDRTIPAITYRGMNISFKNALNIPYLSSNSPNTIFDIENPST